MRYKRLYLLRAKKIPKLTSSNEIQVKNKNSKKTGKNNKYRKCSLRIEAPKFNHLYKNSRLHKPNIKTFSNRLYKIKKFKEHCRENSFSFICNIFEGIVFLLQGCRW